MYIGSFADLKNELKAIQKNYKSGMLSMNEYLYLTAQILRAMKAKKY